MAVLTKVKEKVAGYDDYDRASRVKSRLNKILLLVKVILMVAIFVAFAIYDSTHPVITISSVVELPWELPRIYIDYATVDSCYIERVDFNENYGWIVHNNVTDNRFRPINCTSHFIPYADATDTTWENYYNSTDTNTNSTAYKRTTTRAVSSGYHWIFTPDQELHAIGYDRFEMTIGLIDCLSYNGPEIFYTVYDPNSVDLYSDNLASCGYESFISMTKQVFLRANGKREVQYSLSMTGFAPLYDNNLALLTLIGNVEVLTTTEETPFGLCKRIITDAGGLVSVVVLVATAIEFIVLRLLFSEAEFYYPHEFREMVLWITDPENKRASNGSSPRPHRANISVSSSPENVTMDSVQTL